MKKIEEIFVKKEILPVVTIKNSADSNKIADELIKKNISKIEVTLRSEAALDAIKILSKRKDIMVGAGTITNIEKFKQSSDAGAKFFVSPGVTEKLLNYSLDKKLPLIPGIQTASEIMLAEEFGFYYLKFFPAESAGGIKMLKSFAPVFPKVKFCPTGGLSEANYNEYLSMENVFAVGGSWLA